MNLNWFGPTTERLVLPLRRLFNQYCCTTYSSDFDDIAFTLRIGESFDSLGPVVLHPMSSSINIDVNLSFDPYEYPDGYAVKIATWVRRAADELATNMDQSEQGFDSQAFRTECVSALSQYERSQIS